MACYRVQPGDLVRTKRHREPILVRGRNNCDRSQAWGEIVKNGRPDKNTMKLFSDDDVIAVDTEAGIQMLLVDGADERE